VLSNGCVYRVTSKGLRETRIRQHNFGTTAKQVAMVCAHAEKKRQWVKKCMEYEVEGTRRRSRSNKTWREIVEKDCQARKLNKKDAMDHKRCRKQIRDD